MGDCLLFTKCLAYTKERYMATIWCLIGEWRSSVPVDAYVDSQKIC